MRFTGVIISGGQTGVDQAALRAAQDLGIHTGGYAPKGWRTEKGPAAWLAQFGLIESASPNYLTRTAMNVQRADATLWVGSILSPGAKATFRCVVTQVKPYDTTPLPDDVLNREKEVRRLRKWIRQYHVVNVAGHRESSHPGIHKYAYDLLTEVLR